MQQFDDKRFSSSQAWLWIFLWTLLISGSSWMGWLYYLHIKELRRHDPCYRIARLTQTCPQSEALETTYLAQLLDLSWDRPRHLYQFDLQEAKQKLLASPLIKQATIKKVLPHTLSIAYQLRTPIAHLGDYTNTVMDQEGYLFPFAPFFTSSPLPTLYLGIKLDKKVWGMNLIEQEQIKLAFEVLKCATSLCAQHSFILKKIDVSQAFADSCGQRQIVLVHEEVQKLSSSPPKKTILRLSVEDYPQNLANYLALQRELEKRSSNFSSAIIDLRIPHLAFIKILNE